MNNFKEFSSNIKNLQTNQEVFTEDIKDAEEKVERFLIERCDKFFVKKIPKTIDQMIHLVKGFLKPYGIEFTPQATCNFEIALSRCNVKNSHLMTNANKDDIPQFKIKYIYVLNGIFTHTGRFRKSWRFNWSDIACHNMLERIEFVKKNSSNTQLLNKIKSLELSDNISRSHLIYKILNLPYEQDKTLSPVTLYKIREANGKSNELFVGQATFHLSEIFGNANEEDDADFYNFISANIARNLVDKKLRHKISNFNKDILPSLKLSDIKYCIKNSEIDSLKEQVEKLQKEIYSLQNDLSIMEKKYEELYLTNNPLKSCEIPFFNSQDEIYNILNTSHYKHIPLRFNLS